MLLLQLRESNKLLRYYFSQKLLYIEGVALTDCTCAVLRETTFIPDNVFLRMSLAKQRCRDMCVCV